MRRIANKACDRQELNRIMLSTTIRKKNGFAGDVLRLASGTTFAQMMTVLAAPFLTRLYAPDTFGAAALFVSITGILGGIACMRYELAILLPEQDVKAANMLGVSLGFSLLVTLFTVFLVWWGGAPLLKWLKTPDMGRYLWPIPLMVMTHGLFMALNYWNSRTKHFGRLSIAQVNSALTTTSMRLGLGFAGHATAGSLIGATIAGQTVVTAVLGGQIWRDDRKLFLKSIHWRLMWEGIKRYKKFPIYDSWAAMMNVASVQVPPLLLATFFSSTVVGFYDLGFRLLNLPMVLVGRAIAQVFFQRAARAKDDGTLSFVVRNVFLRLMTLGLFPILLVMITGKEIFCTVFGVQWSEAGFYAQILSPWILLSFVSSPISTIFSILEMQGRFLVFNLVLLVSRVVSLAIGGFMDSIIVALMLFSITGSIMYFFFCIFILRKSGLKMKVLVDDTLRIFTIAFIALLPVVVLKVYGTQSLTVIIIADFLSAVLYYTLLYFLDPELQKLVANYVGRFLHMT